MTIPTPEQLFDPGLAATFEGSGLPPEDLKAIARFSICEIVGAINWLIHIAEVIRSRAPVEPTPDALNDAIRCIVESLAGKYRLWDVQGMVVLQTLNLPKPPLEMETSEECFLSFMGAAQIALRTKVLLKALGLKARGLVVVDEHDYNRTDAFCFQAVESI